MAECCFVVGRDILRPLEHLHRLCRPEREGIDRAAGPRTAGATMAVAHGIRLAGHPKLDCAAEARALIRTGHDVPPCLTLAIAESRPERRASVEEAAVFLIPEWA